MFLNLAINPKSACLTTYFLRQPKVQSTNVVKTSDGLKYLCALLYVERPLSYFNCSPIFSFVGSVSEFTSRISLVLAALTVEPQISQAGCPHQPDLTSFPSESDPVTSGIPKGVSCRLKTGLSGLSVPGPLWLSSALEALPPGPGPATAPSTRYQNLESLPRLTSPSPQRHSLNAQFCSCLYLTKSLLLQSPSAGMTEGMASRGSCPFILHQSPQIQTQAVKYEQRPLLNSWPF